MKDIGKFFFSSKFLEIPNEKKIKKKEKLGKLSDFFSLLCNRKLLQSSFLSLFQKIFSSLHLLFLFIHSPKKSAQLKNEDV
jgi:hypothetical protein